MTDISKELVLDYIRKNRSPTVEDLETGLAAAGVRYREADLLEIVHELESEGRVSFAPQKPGSFASFFGDLDSAWWIYSMISVSLVEVPLVIFQSQNVFLQVVRTAFGLLLLGFLPGFATVRVLLPGDPYPPLERILLSIFLSVVVSIALGVILGAGYFFNGVTSVAALSGYTIALTLAAAYRRYSFLRSR